MSMGNSQKQIIYRRDILLHTRKVQQCEFSQLHSIAVSHFTRYSAVKVIWCADHPIVMVKKNLKSVNGNEKYSKNKSDTCFWFVGYYRS